MIIENSNGFGVYYRDVFYNYFDTKKEALAFLRTLIELMEL